MRLVLCLEWLIQSRKDSVIRTIASWTGWLRQQANLLVMTKAEHTLEQTEKESKGEERREKIHI